MCKDEDESDDHLLIHCGVARELWHFLFSFFGILWVLPFSIKDLLEGWHGSFVGRKRRKVWRTAPLCLLQII